MSPCATTPSPIHQFGKRTSNRQVLVFPAIPGEFSIDDNHGVFCIDENDYHVVCELFKGKAGEVERFVRTNVELRENDEEKRVYKLRVPNSIQGGLPPSILQLEHLVSLDLRGSGIESLPPWIGRLQNLKALDLSYTTKLKEIPNEIGDLASLDTLNLKRTGIKELPATIGRLKNLRHLDLSFTTFKETGLLSLELPIEMGDLSNLENLKLKCSTISSLPPSIGTLKNLKHLDLSHTYKLGVLPEEIGDLEGLNKLNLSCSHVTRLSPAIGRLQNLEELNLSSTRFQLPIEIGDLAQLKNLDLCNSKATSLPSSIGRLRNLENLDISSTQVLQFLPDEIGDLQNLNKLDLCYSLITELPPSIGRLRNLQDLNLSSTYMLSVLPKEMGGLTGLRKLNLAESKIASIPPSIGQLQNLQELNLTSTRNLSNLPKEIGNLANLERLAIQNSGVSLELIPDWIGSLKGIMRLDLFYSIYKINDLKKSEYESLMMLTQRCQKLGSFGVGTCIDIRDVERVEETPHSKKLWYALMYNRGRTRTGFGRADEESLQGKPKLWPLLLNNAKRAFDGYSCDTRIGPRISFITKPDAIYQLLVDGRESFVSFLIDRKKKKVPTRLEA